jgi:hypothetical protein
LEGRGRRGRGKGERFDKIDEEDGYTTMKPSLTHTRLFELLSDMMLPNCYDKKDHT